MLPVEAFETLGQDEPENSKKNNYCEADVSENYMLHFLANLHPPACGDLDGGDRQPEGAFEES